MEELDLSRFDNSGSYDPGRPVWLQAAWFFLGLPLLRSAWIPSSGFRVSLLRLFGAKLGQGILCKPGLRVKHPWLLTVGDYTWLGEDCWIDNVAPVHIGSHACLSQGVYVCTGNHDWADPAFALMLGPVTVEDGAWAGAKSILCPGITLGRLAILAAGGVAYKSIPAGEIHGGNPAVFLRVRPLRAIPRSAAY